MKEQLQALVENKAHWIGGTLSDYDGLIFSQGHKAVETTIKDIKLEDSYFTVNGDSFNCGFNLDYARGIIDQDEGFVEFSGYGGHSFTIEVS